MPQRRAGRRFPGKYHTERKYRATSLAAVKTKDEELAQDVV